MRSKNLNNIINIDANGEYFYINDYIPKSKKGISVPPNGAEPLKKRITEKLIVPPSYHPISPNNPEPFMALDEYSELILRYKKADYNTISFFARLLGSIIFNYLYPYDLILPVPPSNSYLDDYPGSIICSYLDAAGLINYLRGRIVCVKGHMPNHIAGAKSKISLADSIKVKDTMEFESKNIILFDDIITTGMTFRTIKQILLDKGANSVAGLFLGKTLFRANRFSVSAKEFNRLQGDFNG